MSDPTFSDNDFKNKRAELPLKLNLPEKVPDMDFGSDHADLLCWIPFGYAGISGGSGVPGPGVPGFDIVGSDSA